MSSVPAHGDRAGTDRMMRTRLHLPPAARFWLGYLASYAVVVALTIGAFA
ncbi:hypothetical protein [Aureimonas sp. SK2]|nr:hypothetical protein [Aureimonas sp. SK2]